MIYISFISSSGHNRKNCFVVLRLSSLLSEIKWWWTFATHVHGSKCASASLLYRDSLSIEKACLWKMHRVPACRILIFLSGCMGCMITCKPNWRCQMKVSAPGCQIFHRIQHNRSRRNLYDCQLRSVYRYDYSGTCQFTCNDNLTTDTFTCLHHNDIP